MPLPHFCCLNRIQIHSWKNVRITAAQRALLVLSKNNHKYVKRSRNYTRSERKRGLVTVRSKDLQVVYFARQSATVPVPAFVVRAKRL